MVKARTDVNSENPVSSVRQWLQAMATGNGYRRCYLLRSPGSLTHATFAVFEDHGDCAGSPSLSLSLSPPPSLSLSLSPSLFLSLSLSLCQRRRCVKWFCAAGTACRIRAWADEGNIQVLSRIRLKRFSDIMRDA